MRGVMGRVARYGKAVAREGRGEKPAERRDRRPGFANQLAGAQSVPDLRCGQPGPQQLLTRHHSVGRTAQAREPARYRDG